MSNVVHMRDGERYTIVCSAFLRIYSKVRLRKIQFHSDIIRLTANSWQMKKIPFPAFLPDTVFPGRLASIA